MKKAIVIILTVSLGISLYAQQRSHMPYSIYGIGNIMHKGFSRNMAMGRTGIALSSSRYLNRQNPASYHKIDSISFFFDVGLNADFVQYRTTREGRQYGNDVNLRNVAIGFRINRNWSASVGIAPYSSVGYKIETVKAIENTENEFFDALITGSGGLNQFYWDNSYELFNRLSLGVNLSYLFGNIKTTEQVSAAPAVSDVILDQTSYLHKAYADFGMQYYFPLKEDFEITLGAVFGNNHKIKIKDQFTWSEANGTVIDDEITSRGTFTFPYYVGGGLAVAYKNNLTFSADYLFHNWEKSSAENSDFKYVNTNAFKVGMEWIPGRYAQLGYFGSIAYRAGLYYEDSYIELDGNSIADKGITVGLGLPFLQSRTTINIAYNYGINGTLRDRMIKENYHSFMLNFTMHDWWFIKRKID